MTESAEKLRKRLRVEAEAAAAEWDEGDLAGEPVRSRARGTSTSQVYSVRIPTEQLQRLRAFADAQGVGASVLMRSWILERLAQETGGVGAPGERLSALLAEAQRLLPELVAPSVDTAAEEPVEVDRRTVRLGRRNRHLAPVRPEGVDAAADSRMPRARRERGERP